MVRRVDAGRRGRARDADAGARVDVVVDSRARGERAAVVRDVGTVEARDGVRGDERDALAPMMDAFARSGRAIRDARAVRIASTSGARVAVER